MDSFHHRLEFLDALLNFSLKGRKVREDLLRRPGFGSWELALGFGGWEWLGFGAWSLGFDAPYVPGLEITPASTVSPVRLIAWKYSSFPDTSISMK
jgi:hypothetical protein